MTYIFRDVTNHNRLDRKMRRLKGIQKQSKMGEESEEDLQEKVIVAEERFLQMMSPIETQIMSLQSLLVWEKPEKSAALLVAVNVLFWLATTMRIYYLIGLTGAAVTFVDLWRNYIWPEIRVPLPPGEEEEWVPVHPKMVSVPELCHYAAEYWVQISDNLQAVIRLRKQHHAKFFVQSVIILLILAAFGHYVPGIYLSYITVMSCLLWPCAWYHNLMTRAYQHMEPYLMSMEYKLKIKRKRAKKDKKSGSSKKKRGGEMPDPVGRGANDSEEDEEEDEEELSEFIPSINPALSAQLAKNITDSESESEQSHSLLSAPPPVTSRTPSRDMHLLHSDDDEETTISLAPTESEMPHIDNVDNSMADLQSLPNLRAETDHLLDEPVTEEDMELPSLPQQKPARPSSAKSSRSSRSRSKESSAAEMEFVSEYFKDSSEEREQRPKKKRKPKKKDEDELTLELAEGLELPDFEETSRVEEDEANAIQSRSSQAMLLAAAAIQNSQAVTQTVVSSLMSSTLSGLSQLRGMATGGGGGASSGGAEPAGDNYTSSSADVVDAEFEFLSQEDLEDSLHEEGINKE